ncbi:glycine zipper family protein [Pedosphaera parvula]|uniref:Glycine-zipper-containing OmpA-like membrane domain-containing protein n=1 Tax=Pedosphaera parvula (strain Ellin514) TaxID=320771 RepID=B9XDP5_PEDPL|nr:glycine zipper family protein [Pedosphaera parvula]EEF62191.1 conserved hypothetical protein [Pedosphaera parvula Ellin514]
MKFTAKYSAILGLIIPMLGTAYAQTSAPPAQVTSSYAPIVFPAKNQTPEQMDKDKADCYAWARQQTGYDPVAASMQAQSQPSQQVISQPPATYSQSVPPPPPQQGGAVRGGARGAAGGAAIGAIAGDAGKGAAIGAASGGAIGGVRQRRANEAQQQQAAAQQQAIAQQQAAQQQAALNQQAAQQQASANQQAGNQQKLDAYKRAFEACMEGKGYTVK